VHRTLRSILVLFGERQLLAPMLVGLGVCTSRLKCLEGSANHGLQCIALDQAVGTSFPLHDQSGDYPEALVEGEMCRALDLRQIIRVMDRKGRWAFAVEALC
jgi:hypothetical protein